LEDGFPVLSAGPTPHTPLEEWDFSVVGEVDEPKRWTWEEFKQLLQRRSPGISSVLTSNGVRTRPNPLQRR
jgi:hypothetical protein